MHKEDILSGTNSFEENRAIHMGYSIHNASSIDQIVTPKAATTSNFESFFTNSQTKSLNSKGKEKRPDVYQPSPTIHTKQAMEDIFSMFNAPLEEKEDKNTILYKPEDDETISSKVFKRPADKIGVYRDERN